MTLKQLLAQELVKAVPYVFMLALAGLAYLRQKTPIVKNEQARGVLDRVLAAVSTAVLAIEQTTVPALKAKAADGSLSVADAIMVKNAAIQLAKEHLGGGQWIAQAQKILGVADFEKFLAEHVEAAVLQLTDHAGDAPAAVQNVAVQLPAPPKA